MLIDIHTHHVPAQGDKTIQNLYRDFDSIKTSGYYSAGIHPWYIMANTDGQLTGLKKAASLSNVLAVGETGLDKICNTSWRLQQKVFSAQIQLAGELNKPLIIHCVKAWEETLKILADENIKVPVIFHGYNKNTRLAKEITGKGYYLSFGKALKRQEVKNVLRAISLDRFFLETDEADVAIGDVYEWAAGALSIELNSLSLQLQKNAMAVFGPSFLV